MDRINLVEWNISGNILTRKVNKFDVCLMIVTAREDEECEFDLGSIYIKMYVTDFDKKLSIEYHLNSLEEALFFVNNYIVMCNDINEVSLKFENFETSDEVITKGYVS